MLQSDTIEDAAASAVESEPDIEHVSIAGFLRRIPHDQAWQLHNIVKFGRLVCQSADAFATEYHYTVDRSLGRVRTFPEPLVRQVYRFLSPSLGWPQIMEQYVQPAVGESDHSADLEVRRTVQNYLTMLIKTCQESRVRTSARNLLGQVNRELQALEALLQRDETSVPTPAPQAGLAGGGDAKMAA